MPDPSPSQNSTVNYPPAHATTSAVLIYGQQSKRCDGYQNWLDIQPSAPILTGNRPSWVMEWNGEVLALRGSRGTVHRSNRVRVNGLMVPSPLNITKPNTYRSTALSSQTSNCPNASGVYNGPKAELVTEVKATLEAD
ncbi:hypothetical protein AVEN_189551-1 [Araneus ventricosus]|uniref:Uncharacterized protein n=1 Tax=Araneus ventricosus TaxID=182803 RepID=A0A4Y2NKD5_ARAVE|nr:hypothetical protein AVEN_189551-1 [Araneus ventricosus]